jgi:hypothetical protein
MQKQTKMMRANRRAGNAILVTMAVIGFGWLLADQIPKQAKYERWKMSQPAPPPTATPWTTATPMPTQETKVEYKRRVVAEQRVNDEKSRKGQTIRLHNAQRSSIALTARRRNRTVRRNLPIGWIAQSTLHPRCSNRIS